MRTRLDDNRRRPYRLKSGSPDSRSEKHQNKFRSLAPAKSLTLRPLTRETSRAERAIAGKSPLEVTQQTPGDRSDYVEYL